MKASETNLSRFISASKTQFVIPVYQRNYDWTVSQCQQLLDDVLKVGIDNKLDSHFIGSIVYVHDDVYSVSSVRELIVIDGQQRLTTVTLIYLAVYYFASESGNDSLKNEIYDTYLLNKYAENKSERLKLKPTENNDKAYQYLLSGNLSDASSLEYSRLVENFQFFQKRVNENNYENILKGLAKLLCVDISLDRKNDDPQRIFESLNSTGLALSQADLIRNYILMGLNRKEQDRLYKSYWEIIEANAKEFNSNSSRVSDFIKDFLTIENSKISPEKSVYRDFKNSYDITNPKIIELVLAKIKEFSLYYNKIINPVNEKDIEIQIELSYIERLTVEVAHPFLLQVYRDYGRGGIEKEEFIAILKLVQTFVFRRAIAGLPTNALNKIFMRLYEDVNVGDYVNSLSFSLAKLRGTQRMPNDIEIENALKERDVYNIRSRNRNYLFEKIENYNNREYVSILNNKNITIEHIFPQNPNPKWKIELKEDEFDELKNIYLNTIGNLTLSGNNGKLGNKTFLEKRDMDVDGGEQGYRFSRLWLNRYISTLDGWTVRRLRARTKKLTERFFEIWPYPDVPFEETDRYSEVNIFDADDPTGKKLEYAIFFDQKIETSKASELYNFVISQLFELQAESFLSPYMLDRFQITVNPNDLRNPKELGQTYYYEGNIDNKTKFERLKELLSKFSFEDELRIKYREE